MFRNGHLTEISINDLVVGDHVLIATRRHGSDRWSAHRRPCRSGRSGIDRRIGAGQEDGLPEGTDPATDAEEHRLFRAGLLVDGECVMRASAVGDQTRYGQTMKELLSAEDRLSPCNTS